MKFKVLVLALALSGVSAFAQNKPEIKFYGFVRNFGTYDSRLGKSGTAELYYYVPYDVDYNANGEDMNAQPTFKLAALTSRLGVNSSWKGDLFKVNTKIEADFYSGLSGTTGTAVMRLRQAYLELLFKDLKLKMGQAWHPMAADMPDCIALEIAVPFGPFSRTPQLTADYRLSDHFSLTGSLLYQMQYTSAGPEGASSNYQKYSGWPELYFGLNYVQGGFLARLGGNFLSVKPRYKGEIIAADGSSYTGFVSDRLNTASLFLYLQYKKDLFSAKVKTVYGNGNEHLNMHGGYGVTAKHTAAGEDGHWDYTPTRTSSTWASLSYGKEYKGSLLLGYIKSFGTAEPLLEGAEHYLAKNTYANISSIFRVSPTFSWNCGPFTLALEYTCTAALYGDKDKLNVYGIADQNTRWVANHRVQLMTKFTF